MSKGSPWRNPEYDPGNWKAICDVCGFQFMADELFLATAPGQKDMRVCRADLDKANPQDWIRAVDEKIVPAWIRPDQDNVESPGLWTNDSLWTIPWDNNLHVVIPWSIA